MTLAASLYIHIPWCVQKCPYCDFNSHKQPDHLPEQAYCDALIADLETDIARFGTRTISSIFFGGGTPSLFHAPALERLLRTIHQLLPVTADAEITLEANPGTVERGRFCDYRTIGINRISLGVQSFDPAQLARLGRIHNDAEAHQAIDAIRNAGFDNFNIDIMHGLPKQTQDAALRDLSTALRYEPPHLSWYQLTLEPNTVFYKKPPVLPCDDTLHAIESAGYDLLARHGFEHYEVSAFARDGKRSRHNENYWLFGDYFGIGAGAHAKLTNTEGHIIRQGKHRQPSAYMQATPSRVASTQVLDIPARVFEFMLNTTRLFQPIPFTLFETRTHLHRDHLAHGLQRAEAQGLITQTHESWTVTVQGHQFLNDLQVLFL